MNEIDLIIVAILLSSLALGLFRGLVREVLSLAAWGVALVVAYLYSDDLGSLLTSHINQPELSALAAFGGIFIVVLMLASYFTFLLHRVVASSGVGSLDRFLGLLFGAVRGVAIVAILILVSTRLEMQNHPWWDDTSLVAQFAPVTEFLDDYIPTNITEADAANIVPPLPEVDLN